MALTLQQFEQIDGLHSQLLYMGDLESCADSRAWFRASWRLLDACLDAGMSHDEPDHHEWAVTAITRELVSA